jgi:hypothetical protein
MGWSAPSLPQPIQSRGFPFSLDGQWAVAAQPSPYIHANYWCQRRSQSRGVCRHSECLTDGCVIRVPTLFPHSCARVCYSFASPGPYSYPFSFLKHAQLAAHLVCSWASAAKRKQESVAAGGRSNQAGPTDSAQELLPIQPLTSSIFH